MYKTSPTTRDRPVEAHRWQKQKRKSLDDQSTRKQTSSQQSLYLTGWRRSQKQRRGWCDAVECGRCYWAQTRWTWKRGWQEGRAWLIGSSLKRQEAHLEKSEKVFLCLVECTAWGALPLCLMFSSAWRLRFTGLGYDSSFNDCRSSSDPAVRKWKSPSQRYPPAAPPHTKRASLAKWTVCCNL